MSGNNRCDSWLQELSTEWAGREAYYFAVTGSTNEDCSRYMREGAGHGTLVVAEEQLEGKGRRGRSWSSPAGKSIYMTLGLRPQVPPQTAPMLTLVMALAVCKAMETVTGMSDIMIKWPNDIVRNGKKLCGILTEMRLDNGNIESVVIGVGINVNSTEFDRSIQQTATSLHMECGREINRSELLNIVLINFEKYYNKFLEKRDMSTMMGEYVEKMVNKDREVCVLDPQGEYKALALGINEQGELLVRKNDGTQVSVYAGEVSVRGIYGYV